MRMRKMRNLEPRMEKCAAYRIDRPETLRGNWRSLKPDCTALWVEVGCGKGKFTAETAQSNPDVLLIAEPIRAYALENHRSERECDKALADRIETIFRVAAANGAETLIMGAFGCGRNGYPVEQVIGLIQNWIAEHPGAVPNVVFAVPRMHADAFREAFGAPEPERPASVVVAEDEGDREGDDEDWRNVKLPEGVTLR